MCSSAEQTGSGRAEKTRNVNTWTTVSCIISIPFLFFFTDKYDNALCIIIEQISIDFIFPCLSEAILQRIINQTDASNCSLQDLKGQAL